MSDSANGLHSPTESEIKKLMLTTSAGAEVELRHVMIELNIFEDIFGNLMNGSLAVTDATDLINSFSLIGNEFIQITFDKPGLNAPFNKTFRIYNIDPIAVSQGTRALIFYFSSEELNISKSMKISKSYRHTLISDIVKDVASSFLRIDLPADRIETTRGIVDVVVPYYNPLQAINWLSARATSTYPGATFFFYENRDGFWFQSLQKIIDTTQPSRIFTYSTKNLDRLGVPEAFNDVVAYEFIGTQNSLENLQHGVYGAKFIGLDIVNQRPVISYMNGNEDFRDSKHTGSSKPFNDLKDRNGNSLSTAYNSRVVMFPTNSTQGTNPFIKQNDPTQPTNVESWLLKRKAQILQFCQIRLKLMVSGDPRLKVGDMVTFNLPSNQSMTGDNIGSQQMRLDEFNSGNYIVTAIRHKININSYYTVLEISRDSLNAPASQANNNDPTVRSLI